MYVNTDTFPASTHGHLPKPENVHLPITANDQLSTSTNSCSRAISYDSGCTFSSASETMLLNHDYADPIEIKESIKLEMEKIDRQKRQNLLYEPVTSSRAKGKHSISRTTNSKITSDKDRVCKCTPHTWCLVFVFVVSSCSLGLCLLITFGILDTRTNNRQGIAGVGRLLSHAQLRTIEQATTDVEKLKIVDDLKKNISLLNKQIPTFVHHLAVLQLQLQQLSATSVPPQATITTTPPQPKRVRNRLSKCRYKTEVKNEPFGELPENTLAKTPWLEVNAGYELVGASCSTFGGSQSGLFHKEVRERQYFQCRCAGQAVTHAFKAGNLECKMHYWECPIYI